MSTNSSIRIKRKDGTMTGIYCHWDGYIENNGVILQLAYNTPEKVEELLKLGDLLSLCYYTEPKEGIPHNFNEQQENVCVAYHRDGGEKFTQSLMDAEFNYTFDESQCCWYVTQEEYNEKSDGVNLLKLGFIYTKKQTLLIDEIIKRQELIDGDKYWQTDEFAAAGHVVEACIKKAKEAREELIRKENEEFDAYYSAYCD